MIFRLQLPEKTTRSRFGRRWFVLVFFLSGLVGGLGQETPSTKVYDEFAVKAAFIKNFVLYSDWPETAFDNPDSSFIITVMGKNPFEGKLAAVFKDVTVDRHPVQIRNIQDLAALKPCHLLYCSSMKELPRQLRDGSMSIMTVGETENFLKNGGGFRFSRARATGSAVYGSVHFEVNRDVLRTNRIRTSSKMLRHADAILEDGVLRRKRREP